MNAKSKAQLKAQLSNGPLLVESISSGEGFRQKKIDNDFIADQLRKYIFHDNDMAGIGDGEFAVYLNRSIGEVELLRSGDLSFTAVDLLRIFPDVGISFRDVNLTLYDQACKELSVSC